MKKQLIIEYKDGGKVKLTNAKCHENNMFIKYLKQIPISSILNSTLYTYPLKDNSPLVLVENGVSQNDNIYEMLHG